MPMVSWGGVSVDIGGILLPARWDHSRPEFSLMFEPGLWAGLGFGPFVAIGPYGGWGLALNLVSLEL